MDFLI